ncbi:MAG: 6-carboxytetrahydropterin synthase [Gammaproteobacteria bacterium]
MDLFVTFDFAASRRLPGLPASHPCSRLHGHTFMVRLVLRGEIDRASGWMVDFGEVERRMEAVRLLLDHRCLNEIEGLHNPTTEIIAEWLWQRFCPDLPGLHEITVQEHPSRGITYYGPAR